MKAKTIHKQRQVEFNRRIKSFQYAFEGWYYVIRTQHNAWIHAVVSIAVLFLALLFHVSLTEWALVILAMMSVWMAEFFNTSLETVVDIVAPEFHPLAKIAKDVSAAAVLVGGVGATIIGLLVFGPPIWQFIQQWLF